MSISSVRLVKTMAEKAELLEGKCEGFEGLN